MLHELVQQVNEATGLTLTSDDNGYCLLESVNGLPIMLSLHDDGASLLLTAELGAVQGDLVTACRTLLEANAFGRGSLGGTFGLMPDSRSVVYQFLFQDLSRCPASVLLPVLKAFSDHGEKARNLMASGELHLLNTSN